MNALKAIPNNHYRRFIQPICLLSHIGITETHINGQSNGTIDNTDWTLNASWQNFENNLFPNTTNINSICAIASSQERPIAYPNPCNNLGTILFKIPVNSAISIRVLDTQLNQLISQNNLAPDSLGLSQLIMLV